MSRMLSLLIFLPLLAACVTSSATTSQEGRAHYLLGASALAENNPTMALQEFLAAEKAAPRDAEIQAGLAQAYLLKRAYDLAEAHYRKAIALSDGDPKYYNNLGALYLTMERFDDAIASFRQAAENLLFANPEIAWTGMGYAAFMKGDLVAAERYYLKARELNPRYPQVLIRLGELYDTQQRLVEAVDAFSRAVELNPRLVEGHYRLGLAAMKARNEALARRAFDDTIKLAPDSEQARLARGYLKLLP